MKVLIWDKYCTLKEMGGPIGYMYNIKEYLRKNPNDHIKFYSEIQSNNIDRRNYNPSLRSRIVSILERVKFIKFLFYIYRTFYKNEKLLEDDIKLINEFDLVHFHVFQAYYPLSHNNVLRGKCIITTHTPEPFIDEIFAANGYSFILKYFPFIRKRLIAKEVDIYNRADYIMFPAKEATEVYTLENDIFKNVLENNQSKTFYVPTCVLDKDIKSTYKPQPGPLKVCYIGRHNKVKGYDQLKEIALEVFKRNMDVQFIIGGKEEPLRGLKHPKWIELGWVNTVALLNEVDVFVLPNRNTYFDLILIELLRQGVPVIASYTGGNKYFMKIENINMLFYNFGDINAAVEHIEAMYNAKKRGELPKYRQENIRIFKSYFTMNKYCENYLDALYKIKDEKK